VIGFIQYAEVKHHQDHDNAKKQTPRPNGRIPEYIIEEIHAGIPAPSLKIASTTSRFGGQASVRGARQCKTGRIIFNFEL
jgi:hypothetical protein